MVFLHGTVLMHRSAAGKDRQERVRQVLAREESVKDYASYIPVGNAAGKLQSWSRQGAEILYLSPHRKPDEVAIDKVVLDRGRFPPGEILFRAGQQTYAEIAVARMPALLVEDDCESIGGEREMTYPGIGPQWRTQIRSVVVMEFQGIDHLPDNLDELTRLHGGIAGAP